MDIVRRGKRATHRSELMVINAATRLADALANAATLEHAQAVAEADHRTEMFADEYRNDSAEAVQVGDAWLVALVSDDDGAVWGYLTPAELLYRHVAW